MANYERVEMRAEDGSVVTVNVPVGPLPSDQRVALLSETFDRVKEADDWKKPIRKVLCIGDGIEAMSVVAEIDSIVEAVEFYTATEADVQFVQRFGKHRYAVLVTAPGYYAGPAN